MRCYPSKETFAENHPLGAAQVVWTVIVGDLETPLSVMMKLGAREKYSFLLESVEGGAVRGRYSFIGLFPDRVWRCFGNKAEIAHSTDGKTVSDVFTPCPVAEAKGALASLRALLDKTHADIPAELPPLSVGLVGYMGYDTVRLVENIPDDNPAAPSLPDGLFIRPGIVLAFDSVKDTISIVTPVWPDGGDADVVYDQACKRIEAVVNALANASLNPAIQMTEEDTSPMEGVQSNLSREDYCQKVEQAKEYIRAGDIFQVVLSQRFWMPYARTPLHLYRSLRRLNPSPFLFCLNFDELAVVGSSPEILVRVRDNKVTIRPIAGTRPRGKTPAEDTALTDDLLNDPKELAEHLMLLDLGRNDVGRVSKVGSVQVTERNIIEYYSHVMHIVSNVEGTLDNQYDSIDALLAGFPAGTVSGAPKIRAMEIIDALESVRRGVYGGCVGYFGAGGDMDTCIALRTGVLHQGTLYVQAGGGVVADSDPEMEYQESCNKAKAVLRAAALSLSDDHN